MTVLLLLALLVLLPAALGFAFASNFFSGRGSVRPAFTIGAPIVFRQEEVSTCPGPDARDVRPSPRGELYYYTIVKYLRVAELLSDGRIIAVARNSSRLCFWPDDSSLRKARLAERLVYHPRFPHF